MKTRTYQIALVSTVAVCVLLAAALLHVLLPRDHSASQVSESPVIARGPAVPAQPMPPGSAAPSKGEPALAPVQITPRRMQSIGVETGTVEYKQLDNDVRATGNVDIDERLLSYVQTRFPGWIQDVFANATYQYVRQGQRLFTVYSPDLVSSEQEYLLARQDQKSFSQDAHGMAAHESGWLLQAAEERLRQFGVPAQAIADLEQSGKVQRNIAIDSPVSGYIIERNALPNAYVQPDTKLYTIADLSTVWVYANVFQDDVGRLKPGDVAAITVDSYPGRTFSGRIDNILPQVDRATRTVRVRLAIANRGLKLKPGMFVNVDLKAPLGRQLTVPASAVFQTGTRQLVFLDQGDGNLDPKEVVLGPRAGDEYVVLKGLKVHQKIVTSANFLIDSESQLQAASGSFAPPPPGAGSNNSAPSAQAKIDFTTDPNPPHKGGNTFRVQLTNASGAPIAGAQVAVTFYMPAMAAMGMSAMKTTVTLSDKGNGLYEGQGNLGSGGSWQTIIAAQQNGKMLATKLLHVDVEGGM